MRNLVVFLRYRLNRNIPTPPSGSFLLLEDASFVLLEDSSKIELE